MKYFLWREGEKPQNEWFVTVEEEPENWREGKEMEKEGDCRAAKEIACRVDPKTKNELSHEQTEEEILQNHCLEYLNPRKYISI